MQKKKVGVIGLGRFGSYWAQFLKDEFDVKVWSRTRSREVPTGCEWVEWDDLFDCDAIFLCCAISAVEKVAIQLAQKITPKTVVLDTCSVKVYPLEQLCRILPPEIQVIGTHPMFGPDSGKNGTDGLPIVVSPTRQDQEHLQFWQEAFKRLGLKVSTLTPQEHDKEAAWTQGLAHFVGRLLDRMELKDSAIATKNYKILLNIREEVAKDEEQLFRDLQRLNPYGSDMRKCFVDEAEKLFLDIEKQE